MADWKRDDKGVYVHLEFRKDDPAHCKQTETPLYGRTASGYGGKLPTGWLVKPEESKRWHRVYVAQYSNAGSAYIRLNNQDVLVDVW